MGDQLSFRIYVDPVPEGLIPLIVVRNGHRPPHTIWMAERVELDAWDFLITYDPRIAADAEIIIYLVGR